MTLQELFYPNISLFRGSLWRNRLILLSNTAVFRETLLLTLVRDYCKHHCFVPFSLASSSPSETGPALLSVNINFLNNIWYYWEHRYIDYSRKEIDKKQFEQKYLQHNHIKKCYRTRYCTSCELKLFAVKLSSKLNFRNSNKRQRVR